MSDNLTPFERHLHDSRKRERERKLDWHQPDFRIGNWTEHQNMVLNLMLEQKKHFGLVLAEGEQK